MTSRIKRVLGLATVVVVGLVGVQTSGAASGSVQDRNQVQADPLPNRPDFKLPFPCNAQIELKTYAGHNPDDKKIDMYRTGMYTGSPILASADGLVHEQFYPGGIEIRHGNGWFTTYMHMSWHVPPGTWVKRGDRVGTMGTVGSPVPHLHYEQLYAPGLNNATTQHITNPLLQGIGPIVMRVGSPITMVSNNTCSGGDPDPGPTKFWVDTFADAPGHGSPGGTRTGTLYKGTNYVYCRVWGPRVQVGTSYNSWWLKTDLDVGPAGQYVSAYYLSRWGNDEAKDNSGNDIPAC